MNYSPRQLAVWDAWYLPVQDEIHVYHLQRRRVDEIPDSMHDSIGHAVTRNLVDWQECAPAFGPDPDNPLDDCQPWTGCAVWHHNTAHVFYTQRGSANQCRLQTIGLATGTPDQFVRHPHNPVIVPDARWYATAERPVPGVVDCRDLIVVPAAGQGWWGFYATRQPGEELPDTAVIACVFSPDLVHWEHHPPAFAPGQYACIEVPDVFELNGRWFLTCLTGNFYGNRGIFSDPGVTSGTIFAVADQPQGPYQEMDHNVLLGTACPAAPISCRSVPFQGNRYLMYSDRERVGGTDNGGVTFGTLTTPKLLDTDGDRLRARYSPLIESHVTEELIGPALPPRPVPERDEWGQIWQLPTARWELGETITGHSRTGWGVLRLGCPAESFIYEAEITGRGATAAGLAVRLADHMVGAVTGVDFQQGTVFYTEPPGFDFTDARPFPVPLLPGQPVRLKVVNRREQVEVYLNEELVLAFARYHGLGGEVGLFVDRGQASFAHLHLRRLSIN